MPAEVGVSRPPCWGYRGCGECAGVVGVSRPPCWRYRGCGDCAGEVGVARPPWLEGTGVWGLCG